MRQICPSAYEGDAYLAPDQPREAGGYRPDYVRYVVSPEIDSRQRDEQDNDAGNKERQGAPAEGSEGRSDEGGEEPVKEGRSHRMPAREGLTRQVSQRIFRKWQRPVEDS